MPFPRLLALFVIPSVLSGASVWATPELLQPQVRPAHPSQAPRRLVIPAPLVKQIKATHAVVPNPGTSREGFGGAVYVHAPPGGYGVAIRGCAAAGMELVFPSQFYLQNGVVLLGRHHNRALSRESGNGNGSGKVREPAETFSHGQIASELLALHETVGDDGRVRYDRTSVRLLTRFAPGPVRLSMIVRTALSDKLAETIVGKYERVGSQDLERLVGAKPDFGFRSGDPAQRGATQYGLLPHITRYAEKLFLQATVELGQLTLEDPGWRHLAEAIQGDGGVCRRFYNTDLAPRLVSHLGGFALYEGTLAHNGHELALSRVDPPKLNDATQSAWRNVVSSVFNGTH